MHYYKHHIGDYARSTNHLSFMEHGIYRLLLDAYYESERPLEADLPKLMRRYRIRTASEKRAFLSVLDEFFIRTEKGYEHTRCENEIRNASRISDAARDAAFERWGARRSVKKAQEIKPAPMRTQSETVPTAKRPACMVDATQDPLPTIQNTGLASPLNTTFMVDDLGIVEIESPPCRDSVVTPFDF
jgi:uncharacterized protein YdaU (DUF1376 family)